MAKGVKLNMEVDTLGEEGCLVDVELMGALVRQHGLVDDWIQIDGGPTNVDWHESMRGKRSAWGGGARRMVAHVLLMVFRRRQRGQRAGYRLIFDKGKDFEGMTIT